MLSSAPESAALKSEDCEAWGCNDWLDSKLAWQTKAPSSAKQIDSQV